MLESSSFNALVLLRNKLNSKVIKDVFETQLTGEEPLSGSLGLALCIGTLQDSLSAYHWLATGATRVGFGIPKIKSWPYHN